MLTLHHLNYSRSLRVLWLLEELGLEHELVSYERTPEFRAPSELAKVHPLGKAPVIVDGDLVLAESSAILRYIDDRYGRGTLTPPLGTDARAIHDEWLDYAESSATLPIMIALIGGHAGGLNASMKGFAEQGVKATLGYIASGIGHGPFLMGERLTLADIQMSYTLALAGMAGLIADQPVIASYLERLEQQPAFQRAMTRGGPMTLPLS